jgi:hypothetical protein
MLNLKSYFTKPEDYEKKRLYKMVCIEWYRALVIRYARILYVVFNNPYIPPTFWLNQFYVRMIPELQLYQQHAYFKELPPFDFADYPTLTVNSERKIQEYPEKRKRLLLYMEKVEQLFLLICKVEGNLDEYQERDLREYDELIEEHKNRVKSHNNTDEPTTVAFPSYWHWSADKKEYILDDTHIIRFTEDKSNVKTLFEILVKEQGPYVDQNKITAKFEYKKNSTKKPIIYSVASDLRKKINSSQCSSILHIDNNKSGGYRLLPLKR